jgi:hypothetical protein
MFSKKGRRFASIILGLFFALLLIIPSMVNAMSVTVTVDSATHPVGEEVVVTAAADGSLWWPGLHFAILDGGPNGPYEEDVSTVYDNGLWVSTFTYVSNGEAGVDTIEVYANYWSGSYDAKGSATVEWIADSPKSVLVDVKTARFKLNVKKKGALKIAVCNTNDLNVHDVDPKSVKLMGVEPVRWKLKDRSYCSGGHDGFEDLVFKFKNQEVVKALEEALGRELVDGEPIELEFTGSLKGADKTAIDGKLAVEVFKKDRVKKHKKKMEKKYTQKKDKKK